MNKSIILFDCDTGCDDAIALMMLLNETKQQKVQTVAITCVNGNTKLNNAVINSLRVLKLYEMLEEVPIYAGCSEVIINQDRSFDLSNIHGSDGLGDVPNVEPKSSSDLLNYKKDQHAVIAIIELAKKYQGQLTIVATGPLTNIALAVKLDPKLPNRLKSLVVMGGSRNERGNMTPAAEFNFWCDPEAAHIVMQNFPPNCETHLIDYGFVLEFPLPLDWVYDVWLCEKNNNKKKIFAKAMLETLINFTKASRNGLTICDAYAMALVLNSNVLLEPVSQDVSVELSGNCCRGVLAYNKTGRKHPHFHGPLIIYNKVNMDLYKDLLLSAVA